MYSLQYPTQLLKPAHENVDGGDHPHFHDYPTAKPSSSKETNTRTSCIFIRENL